jgi:hypothetical protein
VNNIEVVRCNNCKAILNESFYIQSSERIPCPSCGSISRDYKIETSVDLGMVIRRASIKAKHGDKGEPFITQYRGQELYHDTNEYRDVIRIIDHENNLYMEIITDSKTGELIRGCIEPLDKHTGHGSAKNKKGGSNE